MRRRIKARTTTYGQRGGEGPNTGKKALSYRVPLPDGTVAIKRSFCGALDAFAAIYEHNGEWKVAGIFVDEAEAKYHYANVVPVSANPK